MQRYTVYFIWKLLYMFRVVQSPIIRSANNCFYGTDICHTVMDRVKFTDKVYIKIRLKFTVVADNVFLRKMQYVLLNNELCTYPYLLSVAIVEAHSNQSQLFHESGR
jgi:hypothetical protein